MSKMVALHRQGSAEEKEWASTEDPRQLAEILGVKKRAKAERQAWRAHHETTVTLANAVATATALVVAVKMDEDAPEGVPQLLHAKPSALIAMATGAMAMGLRRYGQQRKARLAASVAFGSFLATLSNAARSGGLLTKRKPSAT